MDRRTFLAAGAASLLAGCDIFGGVNVVEQKALLNLPGQREGHMLRDGDKLPPPSEERSTDILILGSGAAGLTCAWRLGKQGRKEVLLVSGPEFGGNTHSGELGGLRFPQGAHYLPVPTKDSVHIRALLADIGVLEGNPSALAPRYDESALVHSPDERVFHQGKWHEGLYPEAGLTQEEEAERTRFLAQMAELKDVRGADGKKVFAIPSSLSSKDVAWQALDRMTMRQWLERERYKTALLHWHVDYCCRDDFGAPSSAVSAWAGLHYFCSRTGEAANGPQHPLLTWPQGLAFLTDKLAERLPGKQLAGTAFRATQVGREVVVDVLTAGASPRIVRIRARRVVSALPLFVASRLFAAMPEYATQLRQATPAYAPWLVSSFLMKGFPPEATGTGLSWDNIVAGSESLGYVVNTHQMIRQARPEKTVFTAYRSFDKAPKEARQWLLRASKQELLDTAAEDLVKVYGRAFWRGMEKVELTVRGHAMAIPAPGFLGNAAVEALRAADGPVLFAHSDLSGFSIFEEASWWGWAAAEKLA
jgi:protoporphyrinogen oxidase